MKYEVLDNKLDYKLDEDINKNFTIINKINKIGYDSFCNVLLNNLIMLKKTNFQLIENYEFQKYNCEWNDIFEESYNYNDYNNYNHLN